MSTIIDNVVVLRKRRKSHCLLLSLWRLGWPNQQQVQDGKSRHGYWNQNVSTGMDFMDSRVQCLPCTCWLSYFQFCCTDIVWFLGFHLRRAPHNCTLHTPSSLNTSQTQCHLTNLKISNSSCHGTSTLSLWPLGNWMNWVSFTWTWNLETSFFVQVVLLFLILGGWWHEYREGLICSQMIVGWLR